MASIWANIATGNSKAMSEQFIKTTEQNHKTQLVIFRFDLNYFLAHYY